MPDASLGPQHHPLRGHRGLPFCVREKPVFCEPNSQALTELGNPQLSVLLQQGCLHWWCDNPNAPGHL